MRDAKLAIALVSTLVFNLFLSTSVGATERCVLAELFTRTG